MTKLFKLVFLATFVLVVNYLITLWSIVTNSKIIMLSREGTSAEACCHYLLTQIGLSIACFVLVIVGNPNILPIRHHNTTIRGDGELILDDLEQPRRDTLTKAERQNIQFLRGINFINILTSLIFFFLLWLWQDDTLIIVLTIPWAIVQGVFSFIVLFVVAR